MSDAREASIEAMMVAGSLRVDGITAEVCEALEMRGVKSVLLKGPSIAALLYADGGLRPYDDTDLLVSPDDWMTAQEVLIELGFVRGLGGLHHPRMESHTGLQWVRNASDQVDLHASLWGIDAPTDAVWACLSSRTEPMLVGGRTVQVLQTPGRALHIALHAAQHGNMAVKPAWDLERAISLLPRPMWEDARGLAEQLGATGAFAAGLRLAPEGVRLAEELDLASAGSVDATLRVEPVPLALGLHELAATPGWFAKARVVISELFPSPDFMRWWTPLARRNLWGLAASYPWRLLWLAMQIGPGLRAWRRAEREASGTQTGTEHPRVRRRTHAATRLPMPVVVTAPLPGELGDAEAMLLGFLRHLDREQIEPHVVFMHEDRLERDLRDLGVRTTVIGRSRPVDGIASLNLVRSLARLLKEEDPALVINWTAKSHCYGAVAAIRAGLTQRLVWWQHGDPRGRWIDRAATVLPTRAIGCSSPVIALAQSGITPKRETFVVPPAISDEPLPDRDAVGQLRAGLGFPPTATVIGLVGALDDPTDRRLLLQAIADLRADGRDVYGLAMCGDHGRSQEEASAVRELAQHMNLQGQLTVTDPSRHAPTYIAAMDVMAVASAGDPSIAVLEAMRLGVPVVATAQGSALDFVQHGQTGLLVFDRSSQDLKRALDQLLDDDALAGKLTAAARELVERRFQSSQTSRQLHQSLTTLALSRR